jgi:very-short-patch-repair endonuclease
MAYPREIPAALQLRPFRTREGFALGVTESQLRGLRFRSPFRGVHMTGQLAGLVETCGAASLILPPSAVFSDGTAARLLGLPASNRDLRLHVTVAPPLTSIRRTGMKGHLREFDDAEVWRIGSVRVTSPVRTFLDVAANPAASRGDVVAFADAALRAGLTDRHELMTAIDLRTGRRGSNRAREAVGLADERSESPPESVLRVLLIDSGMPSPEVNVDLFDEWGRFIARADLYLRKARLLVEFDGDHHRTSREQFATDLRRSAALVAAGYAQLRFTASDLFGYPEQLLATVAAAVRERTPPS